MQIDKLQRTAQQCLFDAWRVRPLSGEQPPASHGREWNGRLQLRIIAASGALIGIRPAMVEDIFAPAVRLQIERHRAEEPAMVVFDDEMLRHPSGACADAAAFLQRVEKSVRQKWIVSRRIRVRACVPGGGRDIAHGVLDANSDVLPVVHSGYLFAAAISSSDGRKSSKIIASAKTRAFLRSSAVRTVQVTIGRSGKRRRSAGPITARPFTS